MRALPCPDVRATCLLAHTRSPLHLRIAAGPPSRPLQMQALLQEQKLVTLLHDAYLDPENKSNIGHIVKCSNAVRLQASTLPPTAFLRIFLRSHDTWQKFLPVLCERTKADLVPGLGLPVPR
jgi:hypothetical protein